MRIVLAVALMSLAGSASAHPVAVDGVASEWSARTTIASNLGLIARTASQQGEYVWRDATGDVRTDLADPELVAELVAFQVTGTPQGVAFLLRRPSLPLSTPPIQLQIAIDIDRVSGSGAQFLANFAETTVAPAARWERLVYTAFGSGGTAVVIDSAFTALGTAQAVQSADAVEIFVPWSLLGLAGPPSSALRFTVATFKALASDQTQDIGGSASSNAIDAITDYGNPAGPPVPAPNTFAEVIDGVVDYFFDVWFAPSGEVHAPLVVQRFLANAATGTDEWVAVRNVTAAPLSLTGFKLGDEETPDSTTEGTRVFPAAVLAAGAVFTVSANGTSYLTQYGVAPDAELTATSPSIPDMTTSFAQWATGNILLANAGDEIVVLDPSNTAVDAVPYGTGSYPGVTSHMPAPAAGQVLSRSPGSVDRDDADVDFSVLVPVEVPAASGWARGGLVLILVWTGFRMLRRAVTERLDRS